MHYELVLLLLLPELGKALQTCAFNIPNTVAQCSTGNILLFYDVYFLIIKCAFKSKPMKIAVFMF